MSGKPLELEFPLTCNFQDCNKRAHRYASVKRATEGSDELLEVFTLFHCDEHSFVLQHGPIVLIEPKPWKLKSMLDDVMRQCRVWDATSGMRCVEDGCKYEALADMRCPIHQIVVPR
jgi:hypothetical protein